MTAKAGSGAGGTDAAQRQHPGHPVLGLLSQNVRLRLLLVASGVMPAFLGLLRGGAHLFGVLLLRPVPDKPPGSQEPAVLQSALQWVFVARLGL